MNEEQKQRVAQRSAYIQEREQDILNIVKVPCRARSRATHARRSPSSS